MAERKSQALKTWLTSKEAIVEQLKANEATLNEQDQNMKEYVVKIDSLK